MVIENTALEQKLFRHIIDRGIPAGLYEGWSSKPFVDLECSALMRIGKTPPAELIL